MAKNAGELETESDSGDPSVMMCTRRQDEEGSEELKWERTEMRDPREGRDAKS